MGLNEQYFGIMIAMGLAFLLSLVVFFKIQRKWLGCILQLLSFIGFSLILIFILAMFGTCQEASEETEAMVGVRLVEETRDCRYERIWWMKPDDTYYFIYHVEMIIMETLVSSHVSIRYVPSKRIIIPHLSYILTSIVRKLLLYGIRTPWRLLVLTGTVLMITLKTTKAELAT